MKVHSACKQSGFTIFELIIVMTVMSIIAVPFIMQKVEKFKEDRIDIAVAETNDLFQSAQNYAAEQGGNWPSESDNCASAIAEMKSTNYLYGFTEKSVFGTDVTTRCTTGSGKRFIVSIDAKNESNAELLKGYLPSSSVSNSIVTVSVPMPAVIPALEHLLPRDGSRAMTGDLDMDGNNIENAEQVETETVLLNSIVTKGDSCATNGIVARDNKGSLLSCVDGVWSGAEGSPANMVAYFNQTSCPDGWAESDGTNGTKDLRGQFIRAWDHGKGVDTGRLFGTYQADDLKSHTHDLNLIGYTYGAYNDRRRISVDNTGGHRNTVTQGGSNIGSTGGLETRPKNVALLSCQKQP